MGRNWPPKFTGDPLTFTNALTSNLSIPACEKLFNSVFTTELPPHAKNDNICLLELAV
jgi:hypothetical protein